MFPRSSPLTWRLAPCPSPPFAGAPCPLPAVFSRERRLTRPSVAERSLVISATWSFWTVRSTARSMRALVGTRRKRASRRHLRSLRRSCGEWWGRGTVHSWVCARRVIVPPGLQEHGSGSTTPVQPHPPCLWHGAHVAGVEVERDLWGCMRVRSDPCSLLHPRGSWPSASI